MTAQNASAPSAFRVSAIVSTYNGERFIRGCLEDLAAQTLFAAGQLQVVVINSASTQNEDAVIREFAGRYPMQLVYIHTELRETLYAAWNRGVRAATGIYLTNANVDDRHDPLTLARMADVLDARPDVALVYADSYVTTQENASWSQAAKTRVERWPEYDRETLFEQCYIGQAPMWRRSVHAAVGEFDGEMSSAGDYEFWLRLSRHFLFLHIAEPLGLYLERADAISLGNIDLSWRESEIARDRYWNPEDGLHPKYRKAQRQFAALKRQIAALSSGAGRARVALYGAGKHTTRMLPLFRAAIEPHAALAGVLDDAPKSAKFEDLPVVATKDWQSLSPQVVIVSSDTYEMTMFARVRSVLPASVDVWRLYHMEQGTLGGGRGGRGAA